MKIRKTDCNQTFLAVISLDSALNRGERKYFQKKVVTHIIENLESSPDNSHDSDEVFRKHNFENVF